MSRYDWMGDALCAGKNPDLWHPDSSHYTAAKKICRSCPVQQECAAFAQDTEGDLGRPHRHGLWGGQIPGQRARQGIPGGARAAQVAERREHIIRLVERGGMDAQQIAELVGCDPRTVWRVVKAHREQMGEAA